MNNPHPSNTASPNDEGAYRLSSSGMERPSGDPYARMPSDSTGDLYAFQNAVNRPSISLSFYGKEWIDTEGLDERMNGANHRRPADNPFIPDDVEEKGGSDV